MAQSLQTKHCTMIVPCACLVRNSANTLGQKCFLHVPPQLRNRIKHPSRRRHFHLPTLHPIVRELRLASRLRQSITGHPTLRGGPQHLAAPRRSTPLAAPLWSRGSARTSAVAVRGRTRDAHEAGRGSAELVPQVRLRSETERGFTVRQV